VKILALLAALLGLVACDSIEVKREIGYKGKARINPWLAAERFVAKNDIPVRSLAAWTAPDVEDAVWLVPAPVLNNRSFTHRLEEWVEDGGHLVLLVEHAATEMNDWSRETLEPPLEPALVELLRRAGVGLTAGGKSEPAVKASSIEFRGNWYDVAADSAARVVADGGKPGVFASVKRGGGRISVITDARIFRNRWIGEHEHAELLDALVRATEFRGFVGFVRGSGLSLWGLLGTHLWPLLVALGVLTLLWLWKNLARFGPLESAEGTSTLRGYEHHLEALGDFQWRLDRAAGLLAPLRAQIVERGQRICVRSGRRDDDFFQFLADRAALPRERIVRALAESPPSDSGSLTRVAADLQTLLQVLH